MLSYGCKEGISHDEQFEKILCQSDPRHHHRADLRSAAVHTFICARSEQLRLAAAFCSGARLSLRSADFGLSDFCGHLAIALSIVGYLGSFLTGLFFGGTPTECVLFGTYLCSGTLLALCTLLHFKASGHACGCSGPNAMLSLFISPWFMLGYLLLTPIYWSSKKLGRHSIPQLLVGTAIPVLALFANYAVFIR